MNAYPLPPITEAPDAEDTGADPRTTRPDLRVQRRVSMPAIGERESLRLRRLDLGEGRPLDARYDGRGLLGTGGMGEVRLLADRRIGREVAIKLLRGGGTARFLREARVQGQLEHPSIVPVYDVGQDDEGQVFFTMKRVKGVTLRELLRRLADNDPASRAEFSQQKLLWAFSQVCLAVDFAHSRGVIHRDIKPANVMFGDFGEVYLLDWGVAKVADDDSVEEPVSDVSHPEETGFGSRLGTPGYMAPEQIRGERQDVRSDVYALGAILFELVTLAPLFPGSTDERHAASLAGANVEARLAQLGIELPPEITRIVTRAVAREPSSRYPTARAVSEAVDAFLAGDRDAAERRVRADQHARAATKAVDKALSANATEGARRLAMREVSHALSLDPNNERAMRAFVRLVTELPREVPKEVEEELEQESEDARRQMSRAMPLAALSLFAFLPLSLWAGVKNMTLEIAFHALWAVAIGAQLAWARWGNKANRLVPLVIWCAALGLLSNYYGPFILTPALACTVAASFTLHSDRRRRGLAIAACTMSVALPFLLQVLGLAAPSYAFEGGRMIVLPNVHEMSATPVLLTLFFGSIALVAIPALFLGRIRDKARESRRRQLLTTWHLKQFLPVAHHDGKH